MNSSVRQVVHASLIGVGLFLIPALLLLPADWMYDCLAIRKVFGQDGGSLPPVSVESIKKPSTVTFSNGAVVDVGYWPARLSTAFWLMSSAAGAGIYLYGLRRPIRTVIRSIEGESE